MNLTVLVLSLSAIATVHIVGSRIASNIEALKKLNGSEDEAY